MRTSKLRQDLGLTLASNIFVVLLGSLGGILAARYLGPSGRGELAAAVVWAEILGMFAQVGMSQALTFFTARQPNAVGDIFVTTLGIWIVQSVIIIGVGSIVIRFLLSSFQPAALSSVQIFLFSVPAAMLSAYLGTTAQGLKRFKLFNGLRIAGSARQIICLGIAILVHTSSAAQVVALLLGCQIVITLAGLLFFLKLIRPRGRFQQTLARQLLGYGFKSYLGNLAWLTNAKFDQFIMSAFVGLEVLGQYAVAVSYSIVLFPLAGAVATVLYPRIAESDQESGKAKIEQGLKLNLVITSTFAFLLAIASPVLLPLLFGQEFESAVPIAVILLVSIVFLGSNYVLSDGLRGLGYPLFPSVAELVGVIVTFGGLVLFLPQYQGIGAAGVSLFSYALITVMLLTAFRRKFRSNGQSYAS